MNSSRQGERTWSQTSSGTAPGVSTRRRVKSKSVCEAEGKETSISLYPSSTNILKYFHFCSPSYLVSSCRIGKGLGHTIGSTKLWLPSRKSVESHLGGLSIVLSGHCLFSSFRGGNRLYFIEGSLSLHLSISILPNTRIEFLSHGHFDGMAG